MLLHNQYAMCPGQLIWSWVTVTKQHGQNEVRLKTWFSSHHKGTGASSASMCLQWCPQLTYTKTTHEKQPPLPLRFWFTSELQPQPHCQLCQEACVHRGAMWWFTAPLVELRPLQLRQVKELTQVHLPTVSLATSFCTVDTACSIF